MPYTVDQNVWERFREPGNTQHGIEGATLASAATMAPTHKLHYVSGTAECTLIALPYEGFAGTIVFIPAGAMTFATGGTATAYNKPIAKADTAIAYGPIHITYLPSTGYWYPTVQGTA